MQTVQVFGVDIAVPALIIAVIGLVAGLVMSIAHVNLIIPSIAMVSVFFLVAYNVNCVTVGHCDVFAWVLLGGFLIMLLSGGGLAFWNYQNMKPDDMVDMINPSKLKDSARSVAKSVSSSLSPRK